MGWTQQRARHAALSRHRAPDDPAVTDARRDLAAERLHEHVQRVVDTFPPLTSEQRNRIAALLRAVPAEQADPRVPGGAR